MTDKELLKKMPKIDLHYHLDGGLRPQTVFELAKEQSISLSTDNIEDLKKYLSVSLNCQSLVEYLKKFDLPLLCLKTRKAQIRAAREAVEDAAKENVKYIEVRFAPQLMTGGGLSLCEVIENVVEGLKDGEAKTGTKSKAILCCMRHQSEKQNIEVIKAAKLFMNDGVCGVDLAGDEAHFPPNLFHNVFSLAKNYQIPITIHAGEAGGAENILESIKYLGAARIGHGIHLKDNKEIFDFVKKKKIPLEICVTSNIQTKAAKSLKDHPIREYFDKGIVVTANTDNTTVSNTNMTREFQILADNFGFNKSEFKGITINAAKSAFLKETDKENLIALVSKEYNII